VKVALYSPLEQGVDLTSGIERMFVA